MISLTLATALAATSVQAGPPPHIRDAYAACLNNFHKAKMSEKLDDAAFRSAAKAACASQEDTFRKAIVASDIKMGITRVDAEEGAELQIADYLTSTAETYQVHAHAKPK